MVGLPVEIKVPILTIQNVLDRLPDWKTDEERKQLRRVFAMLSPVSMADLKLFQDTFDQSRSFEDFIAGQNVMIMRCIRCELSEIGKNVRKLFGLPVLTLDTVVPQE
jgi:hypothetical protein